MPLFGPNNDAVETMLAEAFRQKNAPSIRDIGRLALLDRNAPGWLTILFGGVTRIALSLIVFGLFLYGLWLFFILALQPYWNFLLASTPGLWTSWSGRPVVSLPFLEYGWLLLIIASGVVLFFSSGFRSALVSHQRWPDETPALVIRLILFVMERLSQIMFIFLAGSFVFCSLSMLYLLAVEEIALVISWIQYPIFSPEWWQKYWIAGVATLIPLLLVVFILRKTPRSHLFRLILFLAGALGAVDLGWRAAHYSMQWLFLVELAVLPLAYPIGIGVPLARFVKVTFAFYRDALYWTIQRSRLRWGLWCAFYRQWKRNRAHINRYRWATVCREHHLRFETYHAKLAYGQRFHYACCPDCKDDRQVYNEVACIALQFDRNMTETEVQVGPTLLINGLRWLQNPTLARQMDAVVIGPVDEADIEAFVTQYGNLPPEQVYNKPLKSIPARLRAECTLSTDVFNMLGKSFSQAIPGYNPHPNTTPGVGNLRMQYTVENSARSFRKTFFKAVRISILVLILIILGLLIWWGWNQISRPMQAWAEQNLPITTLVALPTQVAREIESLTTPQSERSIPTVPRDTSVKTSFPDNAALILIPSGEFEMGNPKGQIQEHAADEYPAHTVYLPNFLIDQFEVTNAQYRDCVKSGSCTSPESVASQQVAHYYDGIQFEHYPVIKITWQQANTYCTWANRRLPTEAEWEKAARWDLVLNKSRLYPWGKQRPDNSLANFGMALNDPADVKDYSQGCSALGVCDMAGNVWEWVSDWYSEDYYTQSPSRSPAGPVNGSKRVACGGSWLTIYTELRTTARQSFNPQLSRFDLGFRCAVDAQP